MNNETIHPTLYGNIPIITTKDPKIIIRSLAKSNCNRMHHIASLMHTVKELQKKPEFNDKFCSARSPEILDEILDKLIYMFSCEANCDIMGFVEAIADNPIEQTVINYDKINENEQL